MSDRNYLEGAEGNTDVPRISVPIIRARTRRADADGSHTAPFYAGLTGLTVIVQRGNGLTVIGSNTITFTSDVYATALADITGTGVLTGVDQNGFLCIQGDAGGDANYIKITGGTALSLLGIDTYPTPGGLSMAGDLQTSPPNRAQSNPQTTGLLSHDEDLLSSSVNRAIVSAVQHAETVLADLSCEFTVPKHFSVTVPDEGGGQGTHFVLTGNDLNERLSLETFLLSTSGSRTNGFRLSDSGGSQAISVADADGFEVQLDAAIYGTIPLVSGFSSVTWGTPDSKDVIISGTYAKLKVSAVAITAVRGNILVASGANFLTNKVQEGDHIKIASASNLSPFSHNGELAIVGVLDENTILVRPLGLNEYQVDNTLKKPQGLNQNGSGFGTVSVYVGKFVRIGMKGTGGTDLLSFVLSQPVASGTYTATLPVATTLRKMGTSFFADGVRSDSDVAFQTQANYFDAFRQFFRDIKLGANLDADAPSAAAPRIIIPTLDTVSTGDANALVTGLLEATNSSIGVGGVRFYSLGTTGLYITVNALWNGTTGLWNKDTAGQPAYRLLVASGNLDWARRVSDTPWNNGGWDSPPMADFNMFASNIAAKLILGQAYTAANSGDTARLLSAATPADQRSLLFEGQPNTANAPYEVRIYWNGGALEFTVNAAYANGTALWTKDSPTNTATRIVLDNGELSFYGRDTTTGTFADGAWQIVSQMDLIDGNIYVNSVSAIPSAIQGTGFGSGAGVIGQGQASVGTGPGVSGLGGAAGGPGGTFLGQVSAPGVTATGGNTSGSGVEGTGGTNGAGVKGTGDGTGAGGVFQGGSSGRGVIVKGVASNDLPTLEGQDQSGNARFFLDCLGHPAGTLANMEEFWATDDGHSGAGSGAFQAQQKWSYNQSALSSWETFSPLDSGFDTSALGLAFSSAASGAYCVVAGNGAWCTPKAYSSIVMEFELVAHTFANTQFVAGLAEVGFASGTGLPGNSSNLLAIGRRANDTNWQADVCDGTSLTFYDLGVASVSGTSIFVRIELHGSSSPYGLEARFFINGAPTPSNHVINSGVPSVSTIPGFGQGLLPVFSQYASASTSSGGMSVGAMRVTFNRRAIASIGG